jgi:Spy/CpxP family protein refolding chaperone
MLILVVALAAALIGVFATTSFSQGFGPGFGPGFAHGFGRGFGYGTFGGNFDPARVEERADRMVRHLAVELDATADQQEKLRTIVKGTVKDLLPLRDRMLAARQQGRNLLVQPTIDRAAIEKARAEHVGIADTASKRIAQALGDAGEVLTPQQRQKLNDLLPPPGGFWRGWHRG